MALINAARAVFLDRDGTLNLDKGYVWRVEDWEWIPGAVEAVADFNRWGFRVVVITNQSGVARGMYDEADVRRLHDWVAKDAAARGARVDAFYFCPHLDGCDCRKPLPGMILKAAKDLNLDLPRSFMIGDRRRDAEAGLAAGVPSILLASEHGESAPSGVPMAADLRTAAGMVKAWAAPAAGGE